MERKSLSLFMMVLVVVGVFAPFATAQFTNPSPAGFTGSSYGGITNTYQSSRPSFDNFYRGSSSTYWPILNNLKEDQCDAVNSDFIIGIPPGGCSPMVVRSDLLAEQNVPVFCQLSAIRVNPLIDVSTIKSISFKGDYPDEVAGISFHPARAAVKSYRTLLGDPIEENIGYVVIVLKKQPDERNLAEYVSGMLTASVRYDAKGAFGTGAAEYYLEPMTDDEREREGVASGSSFWAGKGYLRAVSVGENEARVEVMSDKNDVYRTVTLKEGETSSRIYLPGQYCTAAMKLKLNKIDNSEDMAKVNIDGDTFWVRKGSKLLGGKCVVRDLNVFPSGSGSIEISCSGNNRFTLVLGDSGVILNNGTEKKDDINVGIGGALQGEGGKDVYLGYYGRQNSTGKFAILFDKSLSEDDVSLITGIFDVETFKDEKEMEVSLDRIDKFKGHYDIVKVGEEGYGVTVVSVGIDSSVGSFGKDTRIPEYLNLSESSVLKLTEDFSAEKKENGEYFGEEALHNLIKLAGEANDENMQVDLIREFLEKYPGSASVEYMRDLKLRLEQFDNAGSSVSVLVNNNDYNIRVDGFAPGSGASDKVTIRFAGGASHTLDRDGVYNVSNNMAPIVDKDKESKTVPRLIVKDIDGTSAEITYYYKNDKKRITHGTETIAVGQFASFGDTRISVIDTQVREVAYVSLIPEVRNTKTEANFTFNIGIEKRAIELSPDKANEKIARLNKSIVEWEEKIEKLGELVKGMKAACLATSTFLTLKSFVSGFSGGTAIARGKVMDAYEVKCREEKPEMSQEECFAFYNQKGDIERDVAAYGAAIIGVNDQVKACTVGSAGVKSGFLESEVVDNEKYVGSLRDCAGVYKEGWNVNIGDTKINNSHLSDARDYQAMALYENSCTDAEKSAIANAKGDATKIRALELSVSCQIAKGELNDVLADNVDRVELLESTKKAADDLGVPLEFVSDNSKSIRVDVGVTTKALKDIESGTRVAGVEYEGKRYYVGVGDDGAAEEVYDSSGNAVEIPAVRKMNSIYEFVIPSDSVDSCSNVMAKPYVKYYEAGNKQGFAAVVPIDKANGWYAYIKNEDYASSGVPNAFEICNVGRDGLMTEGSKGGERVCQYFQSSSPNKEFISCGRFDASDLYRKAERQIAAANRNGNGVDVGGEFAHKTTPLGPESTGMECTDFMSVSDCNLMFNVCDPVICPPSRCDLGGTFPVSDVIASGIIGSVALCLPNFGSPSKGGVVIPVCLSGIHAGLDSYVSILKSHKKCLEENVESGVYTGICDEITAVYTCEFFWGQFAPILDTLLVRFVEGMYGGFRTKGGAEYLTVQKSFDNLDKSIDYFSNSYMSNSLRAFNLRNTEEIGSTICKGFVGSSVPTSGDMLDSLLEPESPSQFYAYFSEEVFSDATVPSTSHYKVYYHIYAGNDEGAQYRVYLKSPPESSYYASRQTLLVDSGYAAKGIAADEAIDFTAPTGYKELCVSINGQDECGFGSVTSDFGLNYASQAYVKDQADDRNIQSTEDCVTTSTSAWGAASPNLQAGARKSLGQDDISTSGIVRVCASTNPDKGVVGGNDVYCDVNLNTEDSDGVAKNPKCAVGYTCVGDGGEVSPVAVCKNVNTNVNQVSQGNWVDVGSCDSANMRCWLDTRSVKDNLGQYMAVNNVTVSQLVRDSEDLRELDEQYKSVREKLGVLKKGIEGLKVPGKVLVDGDGKLIEDAVEIIVGLDEVIGTGDNIGQGTNAAKAEALAMKASVYGIVVDALIGAGAMRYQGERPDDSVFSGTGISLENQKKIKDECDSGGGILRKNCLVGGCGMAMVYFSDFEGAPVCCDTKCEEKLKAENEGEEVVEKETIYVVEQRGATDIYFKYVSDVWEWSPDEENWMKVPVTKVSGGDYDGKTPNIKNVQIIRNLDGKDLEKGKEEFYKDNAAENVFEK